jgi:hypothetical protein
MADASLRAASYIKSLPSTCFASPEVRIDNAFPFDLVAY